jgi:putative hydrolase of the HAD superfamily
MVRALVLDIGEILLRIDFTRLIRDFGMGETAGISEALKILNRWNLYDSFERGAISVDAFAEAVEKSLGRKFERRRFLEIWNSVIQGPVAGIEPLVERMAAAVPLYALTNSNEAHMSHALETYEWLGHFRKIFTSHELKARKPEPEIYRAVVAALGVPAGEILFVDDREENVAGAKKVGLKAELCRESPGDLVAILTRYRLLD